MRGLGQRAEIAFDPARKTHAQSLSVRPEAALARDVSTSTAGQMRDERHPYSAVNPKMASDLGVLLVDLVGRCVNRLPLLLQLRNQSAA
jgi:hypothetical protein